MGAKANFCLCRPFHSDPHDPSAKAGSPYLFSVWGRGVRGVLRARTTFGVTVATPASSSQPLASKTGKQSCQNQRLSIARRERRRSPPHESFARREQRSRAEPSPACAGEPPRPSPGGGQRGARHVPLLLPQPAPGTPAPQPHRSGRGPPGPGRPTWRGGAAGRPGAGGSRRAAGCPAPRPRRRQPAWCAR